MNFILFAALFPALFMLGLILLRIPPKRSGKNLKSQVANKTKITAVFSRIVVQPLIKPVSGFIRIKPAHEAEMVQMLRRGGLDLTPKEYYARAIVCAVLTLPLSALMVVFGAAQFLPVTLVLSVVIYFHFMTDMKDKLREKRDKIEAGLPGFIRSILYKIDQNNLDNEKAIVQVDLIGIFEDYLRVANEVFYDDVAILITEMKSMDIPTAVRNFRDRVGLTEVNFLAGALIGLERGEQQGETLAALARDMDLKAREQIKKTLDKRPGKVRIASIPLVIVAMVTLFYVIIVHLFSAVGGIL